MALKSGLYPDKFYVYYLVDPRNNKPYYVGKGEGDRLVKHFRPHEIKNPTNEHKTRTIKKLDREGYRPKYCFTVVAEGLEETDALKLEELLIEKWGIDNLTNMTQGGDGESPSEETKQKMSEAMKGFSHSEESKQKISESKKGVSFSEQHRKNLSKARSGEKHFNYGNYGENSTRSKLTYEQVGFMMDLRENTNMTQKEVAGIFGIEQSRVSRIENGERWCDAKAAHPLDYVN